MADLTVALDTTGIATNISYVAIHIVSSGTLNSKVNPVLI
jgi:hypothetical protein